MEKLYKMEFDCGRSGSVEGMFIEKESNMKFAIGKEVYFGEVLGKHSEVYGELEDRDIEEVDIPQDIINILEEKVGRNISGFNPCDYLWLTCDKCGEKYTVYEWSFYTDEKQVICGECISKEEKENMRYI